MASSKYIHFFLCVLFNTMMAVTHPCRLASLPSLRRQSCHSTVTAGQRKSGSHLPVGEICEMVFGAGLDMEGKKRLHLPPSSGCFSTHSLGCCSRRAEKHQVIPAASSWGSADGLTRPVRWSQSFSGHKKQFGELAV